ncbi:hypothetical protein [Halorubrum sp. Ea8]|uniref:hypothetical protein n=1 Tax=Halorubrum sp. Ea8 TaxID=1383841 RepID=UPI00114010F7|nr:hypothetical protein [Halorubrum sp. Ea8]
MSGIIPFVQDESAGYGVLTLYTMAVMYKFVTGPADSVFAYGILLFSFGPALVIYEISEEFTTEIIKGVFEQHIAILRMELELEHGGEFDDWYSGDAESKIDDLDQNAKQEVVTALCCLTIGITAPIVGYFSYGLLGLGAGFSLLILMVAVSLYSANEVKGAIERTYKVVNNEN